jgi:2-isopropylmalate synthase
MKERIAVLDSTLREGEQTPGVYFDEHIKLAVASLLDEIGVDVIEAGHPIVTERIGLAVRRLADKGFRARVGAHARSLTQDVDKALECGVGFLGVFYCVADERLRDRSQTLEGAVGQISRVIHYARERKEDLVIRYTPEDTVRSSFANVVSAASEAVRAGADIISVADTTGCLIPRSRNSMFEYVSRLRDELDRRNLSPRIAVHCHNDRGLALANALEGYQAGAGIIDVSVLGLGERAGIADLAALMAVLAHDFGEGERWNLTKIPELYRLVSQYSGLPIPVNAPICGLNAFTHCAGVHTQAALRNPLHYQSLDPAIVGRVSEIALDHMAGISALRHSLEMIGEDDVDEELARRLLYKIKEVGETGRTVGLEELRLIVRYFKEREGVAVREAAAPGGPC